MQLGGTFLTRLFMLRTVCPLAGRVAILDELAGSTSFEAIATLAASGALRRTIVIGRSAHHKNLTTQSFPAKERN